MSVSTEMVTMAYRPFVDSLQALWPTAGDYSLWALLPLVVAVSIVYKGTRVPELADLPRAAAKLATQILVVMVGAAVGLYGLVWVVQHYFA